MEENKTYIKIYTVIFFLILSGFIGFLFYEWNRETEFKERMAPKERKERFKKNRDNTMELIIKKINCA